MLQIRLKIENPCMTDLTVALMVWLDTKKKKHKQIKNVYCYNRQHWKDVRKKPTTKKHYRSTELQKERHRFT